MILRRFFLISSLVFVGCSHLITPPIPEEPSSPIHVAVTREISVDGLDVLIHIPPGAVATQETMHELFAMAAEKVPYEEYFVAVKDDSLRNLIVRQFRNSLVKTEPSFYTIADLSSDGSGTTLKFTLDHSRLALLADDWIKGYGQPEAKDGAPTHDDFSYLPTDLLLLPCPGVKIPERTNLLPNAPRTYRSGTHRGIDFPAAYGTAVRCVHDGVVIRADHAYREVTNEFRESLLKETSKINRTPSDIFQHVLLGRTVFVDHGLDVIPGKRLVSIYAHLSHIDQAIQVGTRVRRGQLLGLTGNSGTSDAAKGNKDGAHLHFELIIQDESGEQYLGQGLLYPEIADLLKTVFAEE